MCPNVSLMIIGLAYFSSPLQMALAYESNKKAWMVRSKQSDGMVWKTCPAEMQR